VHKFPYNTHSPPYINIKISLAQHCLELNPQVAGSFENLDRFSPNCTVSHPEGNNIYIYHHEAVTTAVPSMQSVLYQTSSSQHGGSDCNNTECLTLSLSATKHTTTSCNNIKSSQLFTVHDKYFNPSIIGSCKAMFCQRKKYFLQRRLKKIVSEH